MTALKDFIVFDGEYEFVDCACICTLICFCEKISRLKAPAQGCQARTKNCAKQPGSEDTADISLSDMLSQLEIEAPSALEAVPIRVPGEAPAAPEGQHVAALFEPVG